MLCAFILRKEPFSLFQNYCPFLILLFLKFWKFDIYESDPNTSTARTAYEALTMNSSFIKWLGILTNPSNSNTAQSELLAD
jgi:hypothetical protein